MLWALPYEYFPQEDLFGDRTFLPTGRELRSSPTALELRIFGSVKMMEPIAPKGLPSTECREPPVGRQMAVTLPSNLDRVVTMAFTSLRYRVASLILFPRSLMLTMGRPTGHA